MGYTRRINDSNEEKFLTVESPSLENIYICFLFFPYVVLTINALMQLKLKIETYLQTRLYIRKKLMYVGIN